jgi:hypothetical protein
MNHDDEVCLRLGREVVRMIHDVRRLAKAETGYARRTITYPGGEVILFVANDPKLADAMEEGPYLNYNVIGVESPSA